MNCIDYFTQVYITCFESIERIRFDFYERLSCIDSLFDRNAVYAID